MSLLPGSYNLDLYEGDRWTERFTLQTWANWPNKPMLLIPEDLTGKTVRFQIRKNALSSTIILGGSTDDTRVSIVGDPEDGEIEIDVDADDMIGLDIDCGVWDIEYYDTPDDPDDPIPDVNTFLRGNVKYTSDVTRDDE